MPPPAQAAWTAGATYVVATTTDTKAGGGWTADQVGLETNPNWVRSEGGASCGINNDTGSASFNRTYGRTYDPNGTEANLVGVTIGLGTIAEVSGAGGASGTSASSATSQTTSLTLTPDVNPSATLGGGAASNEEYNPSPVNTTGQGAGTLLWGDGVQTLQVKCETSASASRTGTGQALGVGTGTATYSNP